MHLRMTRYPNWPGTLNGVDAIDGTTETTFEAALDVGGDATGTVSAS